MMDSEGRSPLIHACEKRCNDIVRLLIHHHKIKPDTEDQYGNTALIYSAAVGNDVATELLTRNFRRLGLQVDHYNRQGNTALLVAAKNGNINCAKILAHKGKASANLKDKEHGLTPMEWCLQKGFEKDEVDFLKPNTRFYRVAKLATSLSRNRSSVTSLSLETKSKVSPTKSLDSSSSKGRIKVTLSRSKSHAVESNPQGRGVLRQTTVDSSTAGHRILSPRKSSGKAAAAAANASSLSSGKKGKDVRGHKEEKDKKTSLVDGSVPTNHVPHRAAPDATNGLQVGATGDQIKAVPVKISRKYMPGVHHAPTPSSKVDESTEDEFQSKGRSGRLTGLGCSLSITSMQSSMTSLGSSDSRSVDSPSVLGPDEASSSTDLTDLLKNASLVRSYNIMGTDAECPTTEENDAAESPRYSSYTDAQPDGSHNALDSYRSGPVRNKPSLREFSESTIPTFSHNGDSLDDESYTAARGKIVAATAGGRRTTGGVSLKRNPSLRDIDCEDDACSDLVDDVEDFSLYQDNTLPQSLTRLSEEEGSMTSGDEPRSEAGGHGNMMAVMTSSPLPLPSMTDCALQSSPSPRQSSAIISHLRGAQQISQDV